MKHKNRFEELSKYLLFPPGTNERKIQEDFLKKTRTQAITKKIKENYEILQAMFYSQLLNGSEHIMSKNLREFLNEVNERNIHHGIWSMPSSFNIYEAFVEYIPLISYFHLKPEKEYILNFEDYFDFLTANADADMEAVLQEFKENEIFSLANNTDLIDLIFEGDSSYKYYIEGISIIRYKNEFNFFASLGIKDEQYKYDSTEVDEIFSKKDIKPAEYLKSEKVLLKNDYQKSLVFFRIDLENKTQDAKYLMRDEGNKYTIITDDISTFREYNGKISKKNYDYYRETRKEIQRFEDIFQTIRSFIYINEYLNNFNEDIKIKRVETELRKYFKKPMFQKLLKKAQSKDLIFFRELSVLNNTYRKSNSKLTIINPYFRLERKGYWKRLEADKYGLDKDGKSIQGRTWVTNIETWTEEIFNEAPKKEDMNNRKGFIYVMRNASHEKNIFKVGMTSRNPSVRSCELYTTGSPDQFLIAHDWSVKDRFEAEKSIHDYLYDYRLNDKREFFKIEYKELLTVIDGIIDKINRE